MGVQLLAISFGIVICLTCYDCERMQRLKCDVRLRLFLKILQAVDLRWRAMVEQVLSES